MLTTHADTNSSAYHQLYSGATTMYDSAFGSDTSTPFEIPLDYESNVTSPQNTLTRQKIINAFIGL